MFHLGTVVSKPIFSSRSSNSIHKLWRISFGLALLIGQQTHRCLSLHGSPCQLVALPTSGWSVVNQYVRNWPINHDVTLQAFTSSFKGNRTFHFAICFFVIPDENFADWCSGNVRWPHDLRYVPLRFYVHVFYMFFLRGFLFPWNCGRFQCHNFQMGRKKMNVLLLHSFAPEAFLQVPLPANLPRLLDDGERARKAGKAAKSLDLFLDCSKTQQLFMRQIMADIKLTTCKKITRILIIYIYIYLYLRRHAHPLLCSATPLTGIRAIDGRNSARDRQRQELNWRTSAPWRWWKQGSWWRLGGGSRFKRYGITVLKKAKKQMEMLQNSNHFERCGLQGDVWHGFGADSWLIWKLEGLGVPPRRVQSEPLPFRLPRGPWPDDRMIGLTLKRIKNRMGGSLVANWSVQDLFVASSTGLIAILFLVLVENSFSTVRRGININRVKMYMCHWMELNV